MHDTPTRQIGRDARSGRFIPVAEARARPATAVVESIRIGFCCCAAGHLTDENRDSTGSNSNAGRDL